MTESRLALGGFLHAGFFFPHRVSLSACFSRDHVVQHIHDEVIKEEKECSKFISPDLL